MCEMKTEVIEKRKDSWLCRVTFHEENDLRRPHQDMIAEIVKAGREQHEKLFGVETNDEAKKYTQAEMDEVVKRWAQVADDRDSKFQQAMNMVFELQDKEKYQTGAERQLEQTRKEFLSFQDSANAEIEELERKCKLLKKEKNIADVNIAMLESQKRLLEYELSDLREGK